MNDLLSSSLQYVKGVGPQLAKVFAKKGISTIEDALYFIPRTYEDRSRVTHIAALQSGQFATVVGVVVSSRRIGKGRQGRYEVALKDATGSLFLVWFRSFPGIEKDFPAGQRIVAYGEVKSFGGIPQIVHPEYEKVIPTDSGMLTRTINFGRVVPVYSETEGLRQKTVRRIMGEVLKASLDSLDEPLPETMRTRLGLPPLRKSFISLHFPETAPSEGEISPAVKRIIFEEFFVLQLGLLLKKRSLKSHAAPALIDSGKYVAEFVASLPFPLTSDQEQAIREIVADLAEPKKMARLVQGDVGAGKTVVGLAAAVLAARNGYQTAFMAPTEVLAQQHFRTAEKLLSPLKISVLLLTHANSADREVLRQLVEGEVRVVIGTHALFQKKIHFKNLGLVIVDEQHRFGVDQRNELLKKASGHFPHLLMMTATPIPRTLALTLYGDLDLSLLLQKPAGRQPIKTSLWRDRERPKLYQKIRSVISAGQQAYIIYPLVEASEKLELKSATEMFERLRKEIFPELRVALVHGRMKSEEKDSVLQSFKNHQVDLLISTTVIEVGIDVSNATLMVIEHPERLGLSQLHQLRGRVGRGAIQSECILVVDKFVTERLRVMERTDNGFEIAEEDLKFRGPGEFLGTRQSGLPGFRVGHILRDARLLSEAREEAIQLFEKDPELTNPEHKGIKQMLESRWKEKMERLQGG